MFKFCLLCPFCQEQDIKHFLIKQQIKMNLFYCYLYIVLNSDPNCALRKNIFFLACSHLRQVSQTSRPNAPRGGQFFPGIVPFCILQGIKRLEWEGGRKSQDAVTKFLIL